MKLTIALLMFLGFSSLASDLYSQNTYSLESKNEKIVNVLQRIEEQSKYRFFYNEEIDLGANVSIDVKDASIQEILDNLFKQSTIKYEIVGRQIILTGQENVSSAQQSVDITGVVRDKTGAPIPGVTVVLKGSTSGTITDMDGKYMLPGISTGGTLVFSFVGMRLQEVPIQGRSKIDVTLEEETIGLEEVVAIGYGTMKKRDVTGSVASVSGEQLAAVPVANAAQALKGKLPGVNVISQDGRPDASISIRVRGGGSISQSNDPLFIVDGFPVSSISDIPGNQIESIDVLKDASSTAIYGARGANGVIIVTTKGGKVGKMTVTYDGYVKFNRPTKYFPTMSAYDYIAYNWGYAAAISDNYADAWEMLWGIGRYEDAYNNPQGIESYRNVKSTNYSKEVYNESFSHNHNFNISSGNEKTKYLFSVNHIDEDGMKINSWYKRSNASFKLDQKLADNLNFSLDTRFSQVEKEGNESTGTDGGSLLTTAYWFRPIATEDVLGELNESVNSQSDFTPTFCRMFIIR